MTSIEKQIDPFSRAKGFDQHKNLVPVIRMEGGRQQT
jgi:hypothetical protein